MNIDYKEVGKRIAKRRKELGLKQTEVCEICELSDKYLSGIERARSIPSLDVIMRICHALETTPDTLLLGISDDAYATSSEMQKLILQKLSVFSTEEITFILSFIDWYAENRTSSSNRTHDAR